MVKRKKSSHLMGPLDLLRCRKNATEESQSFLCSSHVRGSSSKVVREILARLLINSYLLLPANNLQGYAQVL